MLSSLFFSLSHTHSLSLSLFFLPFPLVTHWNACQTVWKRLSFCFFIVFFLFSREIFNRIYVAYFRVLAKNLKSQIPWKLKSTLYAICSSRMWNVVHVNIFCLNTDISVNLLINIITRCHTHTHRHRERKFHAEIIAGNNPRVVLVTVEEFNTLKAQNFDTIWGQSNRKRCDPDLTLFHSRPTQCALSASNGKLSSSLTAFLPQPGVPPYGLYPLPYQLYNSFGAYISWA